MPMGLSLGDALCLRTSRSCLVFLSEQVAGVRVQSKAEVFLGVL